MGLSVAALAALLPGTEPRLAGVRLIALDGRSGSGKTWLAEQLAAPAGAPVIHLEDLYPGWDGLADTDQVLAGWVTGPLGHGRPARWRRFDWDTMSYAEWHSTGPAGVIILEGCGSIRTGLAAAYAARIWVEAPAATRHRRLRARPDWAAYELYAEQWARAEDRLYQTEQTRLSCDFIIENPDADGAVTVTARRPPSAAR
jgi:uridine kinase